MQKYLAVYALQPYTWSILSAPRQKSGADSQTNGQSHGGLVGGRGSEDVFRPDW